MIHCSLLFDYGYELGCDSICFIKLLHKQAANPGCLLEDFVRWYSPRDWLDEESSEDSPEPSTTSLTEAVDVELDHLEEGSSAHHQAKESINTNGAGNVVMEVGGPAVDDDVDGDGWDHEGWGEDDWDVVGDGNGEDKRPSSEQEVKPELPAIRVRSYNSHSKVTQFAIEKTNVIVLFVCSTSKVA